MTIYQLREKLDECKFLNKLRLLEFLIELNRLNFDEEEAHVLADKALLKFINDPEVTEAFEDINKWYA